MNEPHLSPTDPLASLRDFTAAIGAHLMAALEQLRPTVQALCEHLTTTLAPCLRAIGVLAPARRRTTKAERRAAKRYLAARRRTAPAAPRLGVAACARLYTGGIITWPLPPGAAADAPRLTPSSSLTGTEHEGAQ